MRMLFSAVVALALTGCISAGPALRSAPAHAESLACAETQATQLSYTIYGHTARGTGFTAEKRAGVGYAGGNVSREVLLVDLAPEARSLQVLAMGMESLTRPSGRQDQIRGDASPATVSDAEAILQACGR